ncbi:MAG: aldolase catalytic domain-containing protein [Acutalibacteraceae bacterium]|nr:aldolase catalytic domain-containing protein [Acutalibacteraceae bacterium]
MAKITDANLVTYSPELKVLDCTLRDGGLVNNFYFSDEFVKDLYKTCIAAGIDYMEFGYKASTDIFNENDFGKWKFCKDDDIRAIVGDNDTDLKISVMADVGRTNHKRDILQRSDSPIDLIRVATYINTIPAAIEIIEDAKNKGYEVSCNIMAVSKVNNEDLMNGLKEVASSSVDVIYMVDSFGSYYPEQISKLADQYVEIGDKYNKQIGIHAHNNQQLAFANTITSLRHGAKFFDSTVSGMGRGAGNCFTESLLGFLRNPKYNLVPIMDFVEKHMLKLKAEGNVWGYDIPYLLTGILNAHPSSAIKFIKENRTDYSKYYQELLDNTL